LKKSTKLRNFLRLLVANYDDAKYLRTPHDGGKQGIHQQIFNSKSISRKNAHGESSNLQKSVTEVQGHCTIPRTLLMTQNGAARQDGLMSPPTTDHQLVSQ